MTYQDDLNKKSQEAINKYYGGGDKFIWSTVLCEQQKTRCSDIIKTQNGTLNTLVDILDIELSVVFVLLDGLKNLGKIELDLGGGYGYCYRVLEN